MTPDHDGVGAEGIDWDVHYSAVEQVWSGNPNGVLVAEISDATPGTAVDVGCEQGRSLAGLLELVAPGGRLLFVHHDHSDPEHARHAGFDPADYVMPADVHDALAELPDAWEVQVFENRPRNVTTGAGAGHSVDVVLRARRTNSPT